MGNNTVMEPEKQAPPNYMNPQQPNVYTVPITQPPMQSMGYGIPQQVNTYPDGNCFRFQEYPANITCQYCRQQITTTTTKENGLLTWLACGGICLFGCWLGCCLIPFCVDGCEDTIHECGSCKRNVGVKKQ